MHNSPEEHSSHLLAAEASNRAFVALSCERAPLFNARISKNENDKTYTGQCKILVLKETSKIFFP